MLDQNDTTYYDLSGKTSPFTVEKKYATDT